MKGTLHIEGKAVDATADDIRQALAGTEFFWLDLDLHDPGPDDDVMGLFTNTFHFHPVAVEAADTFGQRPRIDEYDDFVHIVTFGMAGDGEDVAEVHCFVTEKFIVSLHQGNCPALVDVADKVRTHHSSRVVAPQIGILFLLMDTLIDSFFPVLAGIDDAIDDLEGDILKNPTEQQLGQLFDMKREIMTIRKVVSPQRDMLASLDDDMVTIPGWTDAGDAYFRSLYDHLIRISDMVDGYRDLVSGAMDTHLSMVSNRLNVVMKQLAIVATVFLPLGFLTGFFGQNFAWPQAHIQNAGWEFFVLGLGTELGAIIVMMAIFKKRGWLNSGPLA